MTGRLEAARKAMAAAGVDLLAVSPSDDLAYLAGFSPTADERACVLLVGDREEVFVVPELNAAQARAALPGLPFVEWGDAEGPRGAFEEALRHAGATRRVGVDGTMRADVLLLLQSLLPESEFVSAASVVGELRLRKDDGEIEALVRSAAVADAAMRAALAVCVAGARESEIAAAVAASFAADEAETLFVSVASGPNGAYPHHHTGSRELQPGDAVTVDLGGRLGGYPSDLTRMAHVGEPERRFLDRLAVVEEAVQTALAAIRPGATCASIDAAARRAVEAAGHGDAFVHRTGHGLGVSVHEPPWIMAGEEREVEPGMVFSVEPGLYFPGDGGMRLEEIVVVTGDGCRILSGLSREPFVT